MTRSGCLTEKEVTWDFRVKTRFFFFFLRMEVMGASLRVWGNRVRAEAVLGQFEGDGNPAISECGPMSRRPQGNLRHLRGRELGAEYWG